MKAFDPLDIRSQEQAQEEAELRAREYARIEQTDLKWLLSDKRGRRFLFRLLERAGVWRLSFSTNGLQMAFNEGNRNEGLRIMAMISAAAPDRYAEMLKENQE